MFAATGWLLSRCSKAFLFIRRSSQAQHPQLSTTCVQDYKEMRRCDVRCQRYAHWLIIILLYYNATSVCLSVCPSISGKSWRWKWKRCHGMWVGMGLLCGCEGKGKGKRKKGGRGMVVFYVSFSLVQNTYHSREHRFHTSDLWLEAFTLSW